MDGGKNMKSFIAVLITISLILSGLGIIGISGMESKSTTTMMPSPDDFPDYQAYLYECAMSSSSEEASVDSNPELSLPVQDARLTDYPIGSILWQYYITGGSDNSPKAIATIPDINNDGVDDIVICSEDNNIRCFSGGVIGTGVVLWTHNIYSGNIYSQHGLAITEDVNNDGYNDVVVGTTGGDRSIECLSGLTGNTLWTYDTHIYGGGGWVYQVNCKYDYNNDGVVDVLASAGDDGSGTGPNRAFCLDGLTGVAIWVFPLGGAGFSVIGIEDCTGDGKPDALAGCTNAAQNTGYAKGINGVTGTQIWSFTTPGSSVWGVEQLDDITGDGKKDVIIGDFSGHIYGLNAATGSQIFSQTIGSVIITRLEKINDVNDDGYSDIIPAHSTIHTTQVIDGYTGNYIWVHDTADQPWNVAPSTDITGDAIDDVFVGTLYQSNYAYFLDGVDGSELIAPISYGEAVDSIAAVSDLVNDGSMEMVVGGRNGKVTCYSGGKVIAQQVNVTADFSATPLSGTAPLLVVFTDLSFAENTTITSWQWDFDNDGTIDSYLQNPTYFYDAGVFSVSLTVSNGHISDTETKEDYITVVAPSKIEIGNITTSFMKINAEILNTGAINVSLINWSITVDGLVFLGKTKSGVISSIPIGGTEIISDTPVFGLGNIIVTVKASIPGGDTYSKTARGVLLFFFIVGLK
jgi:PKD repeat protein